MSRFRTKLPPSVIANFIDDYEHNRISLTEFCFKHGVSHNTAKYWIRKSRGYKDPSKKNIHARRQEKRITEVKERRAAEFVLDIDKLHTDLCELAGIVSKIKESLKKVRG